MNRKLIVPLRVGCTCNSGAAYFPSRRRRRIGSRRARGLESRRRGWRLPILRCEHAAAQPLEKTFHDVLWSDLEYSGVLDMVSPSFYPTQVPSQPSEMNAADLGRRAGERVHGGVRQHDRRMGRIWRSPGFFPTCTIPTAPLALQKIYRGAAKDADARHLAHQFADDIIGVLSGGLPGIAQTQIAYASEKSGNKEIWVMDYDGANQHQITTLKSISLTPRWSPDSTRIAFTCYVPFRGITSAQICIYSTDSNRLISFPRYRGHERSPAWSPDGSQIAFMSSQGGDPEIYVSDLTGAHLHRVTFAAGVSTSPAWNPKTGKQIVFVSDRGGISGAVPFELRRIGRAEDRPAG